MLVVTSFPRLPPLRAASRASSSSSTSCSARARALRRVEDAMEASEKEMRTALGEVGTGSGEDWYAWMSYEGMRAGRRSCGRRRRVDRANEAHPATWTRGSPSSSSPSSISPRVHHGPATARRTTARCGRRSRRVLVRRYAPSLPILAELFCYPRRLLTTRADHACHVSRNSLGCSDCAANNEIKAREPIRCRECGCRVMYKKRIKRSECPPLA